MKLEWTCLSNRLTSLSTALGRRTHLAVELHTAAGRVTRVPRRAQHAGWAETGETTREKSSEASQSSRASFLSGVWWTAAMRELLSEAEKQRQDGMHIRGHEVAHCLSPALSDVPSWCLLKTVFNSEAFLLSSQSAFWNTSGGAQEWMMNIF